MADTVLKVDGLCKTYPNFRLDNVSFSLNKGSIMGFIGRNGAGKTTTLKALMNLIHADGGKTEFFGIPLCDGEEEIKQRVGYMSGGTDYYGRKKLAEIINVTKSFYENWSDELCEKYLKKFSLDKDKRLIELSEGMKVKFKLVTALSHHAELLILDEPTSGLDPVSREQVLDIFLGLADSGVSILFSTHITSDLEKCADCITYIRHGRIISSKKTVDFEADYRLIQTELSEDSAFLGTNRTKNGWTALIKREDSDKFPSSVRPTLEQIMVHLEKEVEQ